jgi:hypothetical protein
MAEHGFFFRTMIILFFSHCICLLHMLSFWFGTFFFSGLFWFRLGYPVLCAFERLLFGAFWHIYAFSFLFRRC